jgi:hypothetical protein
MNERDLVLSLSQVTELLPYLFIEQVEIINEGLAIDPDCFSFWVKSKSTNVRYLVLLDLKGASKYSEGERLGCIYDYFGYFKKLYEWGFVDFNKVIK